jgi:pyridoxine 4-dehydrogenase
MAAACLTGLRPHVMDESQCRGEAGMNPIDAKQAGIFSIGGDMEVVRLGFGAMRITGPGIWGPPQDREEALRTLRRVPELGIDFIDTADSYGPDVSEQLIREALHPYGKLHIATKGGLTRSGPDHWAPKGNPDYLIGQARRSREFLGVEQIDLWQLHRIDPGVPAGEQFAAIRALLDEGVIRHAGLSEVSVAQIKAAQKVFPVATVQNRYNLSDRASEDVLEYCEQQGIGFIPWYPLAAGKLAEPGGVLDGIAAAHKASTGQIALAWLLQRSKVMLPIPGTGKVKHLEENAAGAAIRLTDDEFKALDKAGR